MILATHAVAGAAVANLFPGHPVLGFVAGFASHFFLDAIPHWHYKLHSHSNETGHPMDSDILLNKEFPLDLLKMSCDALLGIGIAVYFFHVTSPYFLSLTLLGAAAGMLPDALQFAYFKWRHEPLVTLQRFHVWIHATKGLDQYPIFGPLAQVAFGLLCIIAVR